MKKYSENPNEERQLDYPTHWPIGMRDPVRPLDNLTFAVHAYIQQLTLELFAAECEAVGTKISTSRFKVMFLR